MEIENKKEGEVTKPRKMRQIIIETDGRNVAVVKADVMSVIEFSGILRMVLDFINSPKNSKAIEKKEPDEKSSIPGGTISETAPETPTNTD